MNLLGGPLLLLIDPAFVPVPTLLLAVAHTAMGAVREHSHTDWRSVGWAMTGRLPGNLLGLLAIATLPLAGLNVAVAVCVLVGGGLAVVPGHPLPRRRRVVGAGPASRACGPAVADGFLRVALRCADGR